MLICIIEGVDRASNLLTHAVDAVRSQQVDSLLHQICASAAEHTEAQVLQELCFSGGSIQSPRGTDAVIRSEEQSTGSHMAGKSAVLSLNTTKKKSGQRRIFNCIFGPSYFTCLIFFLCVCIKKDWQHTHTNTLQPWGEHTAHSHTGAGGAHSPLQAGAVWQLVGRHRCPLRSCVCVPCEPRPPVPTPSGAAAL